MFFRTLSARIAIEQLYANRWILTQTAFPLPLLIMQGTADRYVDPKVNITYARRITGEITLKVWEGFGHELHNELHRKEVFEYVLAWLDVQVKRQPGK
jgi:alpha-beta hydrolase superfamily lysophospholipase